ncbi:hypothetical protein Glo7428_2451 [Gloeocapsa sp. PCC 7428]|uniref:hypothetical protein n=1 Tax=Gloeocapsa sp. PCC 7428 TaxID=1173026 RepID=UPI0002A6164A|nr:hypothetical protein [Gloeocapsa sp. PCC 7428]AFZ30958.1 hypothetical protein Glo7428_2451 [Gloeocapsa sp. PCC 7428]
MTLRSLQALRYAQSRIKLCNRCKQPAPVLYRIQFDESGTWIFVCPEYWLPLSQNNPHYAYGGTWKARKK